MSKTKFRQRLADKPGLTIERYFTEDGDDGFKTVEWKTTTAQITRENGEVVFEQKDIEVPSTWSQTAINIVAQKYFRGVLGTPEREKSVKALISRVADTIANWGWTDGYFATKQDSEVFCAELKYLLVNQYFAFNSPVWFNVGTEKLPQCSACFVQRVEDSMESILDLAKNEGMIFKSGSGSGTNFSSLRSSKEHLTGGGTSSGPISFMRGFDSFSGAIKSGGRTRRSARMVILNADHPDIEEFIWCKSKEEKKAHALINAGYDGSFNGEAYQSVMFQNANNSVRVTDDFMEAVEKDEDWSLKAVRDGKVLKTVKARKLWRDIAEAAWNCGDPGIQFDTTINKWNTCSVSDKINASNPCCFVGDTELATKIGPRTFSKMYDDFTSGIPLPDVMLFSRGLWRWTKVKRVWMSGYTTDLVNVVTNTMSFLCTPEHPWLLCDESYKEAQNLKVGDVLRSAGTGEEVQAVNRKNLEGNPVPVYDLEVANKAHNFGITKKGRIGVIAVHNSEFMFIDDSACNLASINLMKFSFPVEHDEDTYDDSFDEVIKRVIIAQEIIVGNSSYPTKKIETNALRFRPLGLGYANLGAYLLSRGIPYDSDLGRSMCSLITGIMTATAYGTSAKISRDVTGPFDAYKENKCAMLTVLEEHQNYKGLADYNGNTGDEILGIMFYEAIKWGENFGFRNAQVTVLAPTGTCGMMMDCATTGIEPELALVKYKKLVGGGTIKTINTVIPAALESLGYEKIDIDKICSYVEEHDTIEGCPLLKVSDLPVFDCAFKPANGTRCISSEGHLRMMAAAQPFLSGAVSKTVNAPATTTIQDIENIYMLAWQLGLKSVAVYRDGCKLTQPLSTSSTETTNKKGEVSVLAPVGAVRNRLPDERKAIAHKFSVAGYEGYLHVGLYDNGEPGELFIKMAKEGSTVSGLIDGFATAVSIALQYGVPLRSLVDKFSRTRFEPSGFTGNMSIQRASSILDYVFRWLELKFLTPKEVQEVTHDLPITPVIGFAKTGLVQRTDAPTCADCGSIMVPNGSCHRCTNCGTTSGCS